MIFPKDFLRKLSMVAALILMLAQLMLFIAPSASASEAILTPLERATLPYLQRPFVLPVGTHSLQLDASFVRYKVINPPTGSNASNGTKLDIFSGGLVYRKALSSDLTWIWSPLPFGLQYQPAQTRSETTGVSWDMQFANAGVAGLKPTFQSFYRHIVRREYARELHLKYFVFIPFQSNPTIYQLYLEYDWVWQLTPKTAVTLDAGLLFSNYFVNSLTDSAVSSAINVEDISATHNIFPVGFKWVQRFGQGFDATLAYHFIGLAQNIDYTSQDIVLSLSQIY